MLSGETSQRSNWISPDKLMYEDGLKYEDNLKYEDDLKYEDHLKYEEDLRYEDDQKYTTKYIKTKVQKQLSLSLP